MEFKRIIFCVWLTLTLFFFVIIKFFLLPIKDFEKIFKNNKSIVVVETSYLNDNEKSELIEKAKVNNYDLKMLGKDEYIFEKIKN